MKDLILREFLEFVETRCGREVAHHLAAASRDSDGSSPAADHELLQAAQHVSAHQGIPAAEVLRRFGASLFPRLIALYPIFLDDAHSALEFLANVGQSVHAELAKIHPEARFPALHCRQKRPGQIEIHYRSPHRLADLAEGLIHGCAAYFGETIDVGRHDPPATDGTEARFLVTVTQAGGRGDVWTC